MLDETQDPDLPDPEAWLANFKAGLDDIPNLLNPQASSTGVPGLLGSREDIEAIARGMNGQPDPAGSITASAAQRQLGGAPLPYHPAPSPHAGHYATLDEAAKAAASDVPRNASVEYGAYFPERYVTDSVDLGDGFGPQSFPRLDGYDYGGLYTSRNGGKVTLGPAPPNLGAWFHNHPWDPDLSINEGNQAPSSGKGNDWDFINELHKKTPAMKTYILGPDGQLREFWMPGDKGRIVK